MATTALPVARHEYHTILNNLTLHQMVVLLTALRNPTTGAMFSRTYVSRKIAQTKDPAFALGVLRNPKAKSQYEANVREYLHGLFRTVGVREAMMRGLDWLVHHSNPAAFIDPNDMRHATYPDEAVPAEPDPTIPDAPDVDTAPDFIVDDVTATDTDTDTVDTPDDVTVTETFPVQARHTPHIGINTLIRFAEAAKGVQSDMAALIDKMDGLIGVTPAPYIDAVMSIKAALETQYEALES